MQSSLANAFRELQLTQNALDDDTNEPPTTAPALAKSNDFVLKFLLVGDSDVGKEEILNSLEDDDEESLETYRSLDVAYKSTNILLYGKRVKLRIWLVAYGLGEFLIYILSSGIPPVKVDFPRCSIHTHEVHRE